MCLPGTIEAVRERFDREGPPRLTRRAALAGGSAAALGALLPGEALANKGRRGRGDDDDDDRPRFPHRRVADLSWVFRAGFPVYTGNAPTRRTLFTVEENGFYSQEWTFGEHSGTHMDAPGHFIARGRRTPQLRLDEFFAPIAVIDISARTASDPDAEVTPDDLIAYERRHGRIPRGAAVLMLSGWGSRVGDPVAYKNADAGGRYHFPGFGIDALRWLLERRDITSIGVDTLSLDPGRSTTFDAHLTLLGADHYGLENLARLETVPPRGAHAIVGVIPWEEGSGGPCRVLASW